MFTQQTTAYESKCEEVKRLQGKITEFEVRIGQLNQEKATYGSQLDAKSKQISESEGQIKKRDTFL